MIDQEILEEHFQYIDGVLRWKISLSNRVSVGDVAGRENKGYRMIRFYGKEYPAHRLIWIMHNGDVPPGFLIDHKDSNPLNNSIDNLRLATYQQNAFNKSKNLNSSSSFKGVTRIDTYNKWQAQIQISNKSFYIGRFESEAEAKEAYDFVAKELFGDFYKA